MDGLGSYSKEGLVPVQLADESDGGKMREVAENGAAVKTRVGLDNLASETETSLE